MPTAPPLPTPNALALNAPWLPSLVPNTEYILLRRTVNIKIPWHTSNSSRITSKFNLSECYQDVYFVKRIYLMLRELDGEGGGGRYLNSSYLFYKEARSNNLMSNVQRKKDNRP